jgi:gluconokinase
MNSSEIHQTNFAAGATPLIVILMGVSSSGKTTIGKLLAKQTGAIFADADDFHSAANKQKMASGHPLNDDDREPWLETLNGLIKGWFEAKTPGILACSALKEKYRVTLMSDLPKGAVHVVLLELSREMLEKRMKARSHEFMNPALLDSQIATLEVPTDALRVVNDRSPQEVVQEIVAQLR